jgi:hypothetical protein
MSQLQVGVERWMLASGLMGTVTPGQRFAMPVVALPHRMTATFRQETKVRPLGNSFYRLRGRILESEGGTWLLDCGQVFLCHSTLPTCFAPRKWVEGVFSLSLDLSNAHEHYRNTRHFIRLIRNWRVRRIANDSHFWRHLRAGEMAIGGEAPGLDALETIVLEADRDTQDEPRPALTAADSEPDDSHFLLTIEPVSEATAFEPD